MLHHISIDLETYEASKPSVLTIGSFDGVHLGHQKILRDLHELAKAEDLLSLLLTFWPHPRMVVQNYDPSFRLLNTPEEKAYWLAQYGIDYMVVAPFTRNFSELSPEEYVEKILVAQLNVRHVLVGYDHRFGKDRHGNTTLLREMGAKHGFTVREISEQEENHITVSSSAIRKFLLNGKVKQATPLLGRPYELSGLVVRGEGRGRNIGFPTANLFVQEEYKLIPQPGVYAVWVKYRSVLHKAMLNIGSKPTFHHHSEQQSIEVHLFDFNADLYGEMLQIQFVERLRDEHTFSGIQELKEQLHEDRKKSLEVLV